MRYRYPRFHLSCGFVRAFTLLELLVVVAIISLLLAILMPTLHKARVLTKRITCQSNLRQINLAWHLYLDDNNQYFYQGVNVNHDFGGWKGNSGYALSRPLNPYLKLPLKIQSDNEAVLYECPDDNGGILGPPPQELAYHWFGNSFQTNILLIGPKQIPVPDDDRKLLHIEINKRLKNLKRDDVSDHSRLLLVGDNNWITQWDTDFPYGNDWHDRNSFYSLGFLDGHVEFIEISKGIYVSSKYRVLPFKVLDELVP